MNSQQRRKKIRAVARELQQAGCKVFDMPKCDQYASYPKYAELPADATPMNRKNSIDNLLHDVDSDDPWSRIPVWAKGILICRCGIQIWTGIKRKHYTGNVWGGPLCRKT